MTESPAPPLRDYVHWLEGYDDPDSALTWRLHAVQHDLHRALDALPGERRVLSLCAGDGRDIVGVARERSDAARLRGVLVELHPDIAARAAAAVAEASLTGFEVRRVDAGLSSSFADAVPADLVLLVGIFGNIDDADLERTVRAAPQLCAAGARLLWSRGRDVSDRNDRIRHWFAEAGFAELDYAEHADADGPALGMVRYDGPPVTLIPDRRLFRFRR